MGICASKSDVAKQGQEDERKRVLRLETERLGLSEVVKMIDSDEPSSSVITLKLCTFSRDCRKIIFEETTRSFIFFQSPIHLFEYNLL